MCDICRAAAATATRRIVIGTSLAAGLAAGTGLGLGGSAARAQEAGEPPVGTGENGRRILIRGGHVLSMDGAVGDFEDGDILVEGSRIVEVAQSIDAEIVDAQGRVVMPGFVGSSIGKGGCKTEIGTDRSKPELVREAGLERLA